MIPESLCERLSELDTHDVPENAPAKPTVYVSLLSVVTILDDYFSSIEGNASGEPTIAPSVRRPHFSVYRLRLSSAIWS